MAMDGSLRLLSVFGFIILCLGGLVMSVRVNQDFVTAASIRSGDRPADPRALSDAGLRAQKSADILLAEASTLDTTVDNNREIALQYVEASLSKNPWQPNGHASLAYFDSLQPGGISSKGQDALRESFRLCLICDDVLMKWRLEFILDNWTAIDEDVRLLAFESADFLRWWHLEYEYLSDLRDRSERNGIPFSDYQRRVGSSVRPNEIPAQ